METNAEPGEMEGEVHKVEERLSIEKRLDLESCHLGFKISSGEELHGDSRVTMATSE